VQPRPGGDHTLAGGEKSITSKKIYNPMKLLSHQKQKKRPYLNVPKINDNSNPVKMKPRETHRFLSS
jgi:hypothetical protein